MSFSSLTHRDRFILIFCLIFYFVRPITYDEVQERKLARLHKHHIEVVNVPSKSVGQPFLSNVKPSTINPSLNSYSHDEYKALMGREGEIILVAFRGKFLVEYKLGVDKKTTRLNANLRIVKKEPTNPAEELDVRASIPEDRILAKLYQIKPFGVNLPKEVDLNFARKLPTKPRIEYLVDKVGIKTVKDAHTAFAKHLDNDKTDVFFGQFGCNFEFENDDGSNIGGYKGLYAYNDNTKNMMFFREEPESETGYTLHSYMKLTLKKQTNLKWSIFGGGDSPIDHPHGSWIHSDTHLYSFTERWTESFFNGFEWMGNWIPENGGLYYMDQYSATNNVSMATDYG